MIRKSLGLTALLVLSQLAALHSSAEDKLAGPPLDCPIVLSPGSAEVARSAQGELISVFPERFPHDNVASLAISPDNGLLASGNGHFEGRLDSEAGEVKVWDLNKRNVRSVFRTKSRWSVTHVVFSSDSGSLICATQTSMLADMKGIVQIWDVAGSQEKWHAELPRELINCVAASKDGRWIAAGTYGAERNLHVWDARGSVKPIALKAHKDATAFVGFAPDESTLVTVGRDGQVCLWDTAKWIEAYRFGTSGDWTVALSPSKDLPYLAIRSVGRRERIVLWNYKKRRKLYELIGHTRPVESMAFSADGRLFASGTGLEEGMPPEWGSTPKRDEGRTEIRIWDVGSGKTSLILSGHVSPISALAFSPSGPLLASGDGNNAIKLWDIKTLTARSKNGNRDGKKVINDIPGKE